MTYYYILFVDMLTLIWVIYIDAFLASNANIMTGNITFVCAFYRQKDLSIDDMRMPEILTFCSCAVIHESWVLTSRQCYVQLDWFISPITEQFTTKLPGNLHKIEEISDKRELSLVRVSPAIFTGKIELAPTYLPQTMICELYGFSPPNNLIIQGDNDSYIYKIWKMEGDLLQAKIMALNYTECGEKFDGLSSNKRDIAETTLCISPLDKEYLEPCSFDRGAPIICNGKLQGILVYNRPVPKKIPMYLPAGCYGGMNNRISIYAEGITPQYVDWIFWILSKK